MNDRKDPKAEAERLWRSHVDAGEPLDVDELGLVLSQGLAKAEDWEDRGGGLYWHAPTWPDPDAAE